MSARFADEAVYSVQIVHVKNDEYAEGKVISVREKDPESTDDEKLMYLIITVSDGPTDAMVETTAFQHLSQPAPIATMCWQLSMATTRLLSATMPSSTSSTR